MLEQLHLRIHRKMSVFLEASGKLNPNQHGFRQKHSCQTQLLETVHQWANTINAGQSTHAAASWINARWDSSNKKWSRSYDESLAELHWSTIEQRHSYLSLCQIYN